MNPYKMTKKNFIGAMAAPAMLAALLLTGCVMGPDPASLRAQAAEARRIASLLDDAEADFAARRLTTPVEKNAYRKFLKVLSLDKLNQTALDGINRIVEQYLTWAIDNASQGNYSRASGYVRIAQSIDKDHPNIRTVVTLIEKSKSNKSTRYTLDTRAVAQREATKIDFAQISAQIAKTEAFITIRASTDAAGRWLYQQLSRYSNERIEARFETGSPPTITLER